jgi:Flp pilus assembly protein TadB
MPSSSSPPPRTGGFQYRRRGPSNPGMRVSDAERTAVADQLSRHYGDGRLDQTEFDERMHKAMTAKTQADFAGIFDDLPDLHDPDAPAMAASPPPVPRRRPGVPLIRLLFFAVLAVVAVAVVGHMLTHSLLLWLAVAVIAFLWLRDNSRGRRY